MSPIHFAAVTHVGAAGGAIFLLGTWGAPDAVYVDGAELRPVSSTLPSSGAVQVAGATSIVVPIPARAKPGWHVLKVVRGTYVWRSVIRVVRTPRHADVETDARCLRSPDGDYAGSYSCYISNGRRRQWGATFIGQLVCAADGGLSVSLGDYFWPFGHNQVGGGLTIQGIYPNGALGSRWRVDEVGHPEGPPLPNDPAAPLWETCKLQSEP